MIKYKLKCKSSYCSNEKDFDGWFQNIEAYEKQKSQGLINCPICGSDKIIKSLTTPSLKTNKIKFITDDPAAIVDIPHFCNEQGHLVLETFRENDYELFIIESFSG